MTDALLALIRVTLAASAEQRFQTPSAEVGYSRVLLVGTHLGIYASLTVLLRQQGRVERVETVVEALAYPADSPPAVLVVDLASTGQPAHAIPRLRAHAPRAHLVVIQDRSKQNSALIAASALLVPPTRLSDLLREIRTSVKIDLPSYSSKIIAVLDYLGDRYTDGSIRRLGRAVAASPYYLSTLFRAETGMSLRAYINQLRVEAARWLLLETTEKMETIAVRIGLHDASHLSRLFQKYTGDRPGAYRRQQADDSGRLGAADASRHT
jgi:AraC-like DNA-binding protein